jgi:galactose mutarotase-like enzyme
MHFDGFPYTGLWSKPSGAPFICIEPWFGMADVIGHDQDIMQKKGMLMLEPQMTFTSEYMIKIS